MSYDSDSDREEEFATNEPIPADPLVDQFEDVLLAWKKKNLLKATDNTQDPAVLDRYVKRCRTLYGMLKTFFDALPLTQTNADIEEFLPWVQDIWNKDPSTRYAMEHIVQRDLLVYPYILNKEHTQTINAAMRKKETRE